MVNLQNESERISDEVYMLDEESSRKFYSLVKDKLRDPDTFATLAWFGPLGVPSFYLGRYVEGLLLLIAFFVGIACLFACPVVGIGILFLLGIMDFVEVCRSQTTVLRYNNTVRREALSQVKR